MRFVDYLRWVIWALWMQRMRSILTIVGFAIGIAAMVLLSSLGEGLRQFVIQEFTQFGSHIVAITPGKTETFGLSGILNTTRPMSLADAEALARIPGVQEVVPVVMGTAQIKAKGMSRYTDVAGVGALADKAWKLDIAQGTFLPVEDMSRARAFAVLGSKLKQELFGNSNPLGEFVHVGGNRFRVVGVTAPKGQFLGTDLDDMIYIPANKGLQLFNRESLMEVDIFYSPSVTTATLTKKIRKLLIDRHGFEDFTLITQDQMMETMDNILKILKYAGGGLGAISLLVGAVGISTILMITVAERTSEVGLLRAMGCTRSVVRNLFLGEAVMLGLIGGITGVMTVALVAVMLQLFLPALPMAVKPEIVTVALMVSMVVGLIAGVRPALNATRLSPIDALRGE